MAESKWLWFDNDGGPLIVLPREAVQSWQGSHEPSGGRVVEATLRWRLNSDAATDYDRACDVNNPAAVLDVGSSWGLVLNDISSAAWMQPVVDQPFFIVHVEYADDSSDEAIFEAYTTCNQADWKRIGEVPSESGDLILMHAGSRGDRLGIERSPTNIGPALIGDAITLTTTPGRYSIEMGDVEVPDEALFTFFRFSALG